jgi:hypothetical protein
VKSGFVWLLTTRVAVAIAGATDDKVLPTDETLETDESLEVEDEVAAAELISVPETIMNVVDANSETLELPDTLNVACADVAEDELTSGCWP